MRVIWLQRGAVFNSRGMSTPRGPGDEDDLSTGLAQRLIAVKKVRRAPLRSPAPVAKIVSITEETEGTE